MKSRVVKGILSLSFAVLASQALGKDPAGDEARNEITSDVTGQQDITGSLVMKAIDESRAKSPDIHNDALRVWKNFKSGRIKPNVSYYFWASDLIFWLEKEGEVEFASEEKVAKVFTILKDKELISPDAEKVLTEFVWGKFQRLKMLTPEERAMPQYRQELERIASENLNEVEQQDKK
jgi:hypothetical protein